MNKTNQVSKEKKIPKWARELHDENCDWECADDRIQVGITCRKCGTFDKKAVGHKGSNYLCGKCFSMGLQEIL